MRPREVDNLGAVFATFGPATQDSGNVSCGATTTRFPTYATFHAAWLSARS